MSRSEGDLVEGNYYNRCRCNVAPPPPVMKMCIFVGLFISCGRGGLRLNVSLGLNKEEERIRCRGIIIFGSKRNPFSFLVIQELFTTKQ